MHNRKYCVENESDRPLGNKNDFELLSMSVFCDSEGKRSVGDNIELRIGYDRLGYEGWVCY